MGIRSAAPIVLLLVSGCFKPTFAPPDDDPHARHEMYLERVADEEPAERCDRDVELVREQTVTREREQVGSISVTCDATSSDACERRLAARACELGADAVVIGDGDADFTGPPAGVGNPRDRTLGGTAVRWLGP